MTLFFFARRNIMRALFRSIAIALGIAIVAATLFSVAVLREAEEAALEQATSRLGAELIVIPAGTGKTDTNAMAEYLAGESSEFKFNLDGNIIGQVRGFDGIKEASPLYFTVPLESSSETGPAFSLVGFDPDTDFTVSPWIKERKKLAPGELFKGAGVPFGRDNTIDMYGENFIVADTLEATGLKFLDTSVFLPLSVVWDLTKMPGKISAIMIKTGTSYNSGHIRMLGSMIEGKVNGVKVLVIEEMIPILRKQLSVLLRGILLTGIVIWLMAIVMINIVFSMIMNERQREIGLLRAMGASRGQIAAVPLLEASLLTTAGATMGIITAMGMLSLSGKFLFDSLKFPLIMPSAGSMAILAASGLIASIATGLLAALLPAIRAARWEPYESIRKEE